MAWVLPGQGSLRTGCLGRVTDPEERDGVTPLVAAAREAVDEVAAATGRELRALGDDPTTAARTADAQPAILAASLAAAAALRAAGLRPDVVAGHSLGECSAAIVAGVLTREEGARVVAARGAAMADACAAVPGGLAAVVKLSPAAVDALLDEHPDLVLANDNAPGQVVVAGPQDGLRRLRADVRRAGGRLVPLDVEGAFHSPAMRSAVAPLEAALGRVRTADPTVPLITGTTVRQLESGAAVARALSDGVLAPVRWREVQLALAADGITHLVEVGPGGVLAGLARRTVPHLEVRSVATPGDAAALALELGVVAATR
jgi:[acyl-carrier-protein] S-malonyltransferase